MKVFVVREEIEYGSDIILGIFSTKGLAVRKALKEERSGKDGICAYEWELDGDRELDFSSDEIDGVVARRIYFGSYDMPFSKPNQELVDAEEALRGLQQSEAAAVAAGGFSQQYPVAAPPSYPVVVPAPVNPGGP